MGPFQMGLPKALHRAGFLFPAKKAGGAAGTGSSHSMRRTGWRNSLCAWRDCFLFVVPPSIVPSVSFKSWGGGGCGASPRILGIKGQVFRFELAGLGRG